MEELVSKNLREANQKRNKSRREVVKDILRHYKDNLDYIDVLNAEISEKRERIDGVKSGLGNTDPSKGGGSSQEDRIIKVLDEIRVIEQDLDLTKKETNSIRKAIKKLDNPQLEAIIYHKWVYGDESIRSLATKYGLSHTAIWKKSDVALLKLYKILILDKIPIFR